MKKFAEIYQSKVVAIHEVPDAFTVQFSPQSFRFAKDITGISPQPQPGWPYGFETDTFTEPVPASQGTITSKAFFERFTALEREAFCSSVDTFVSHFRYWLTLTGDVNLTDPTVIAGVTKLETPKAILGPGRAAIVLTVETI